MKKVRFENYQGIEETKEDIVSHISSAMSFDQVKEQYNLVFDQFGGYAEYGFRIILIPREDMKYEDAPLYGSGWEELEQKYENLLHWVKQMEEFHNV